LKLECVGDVAQIAVQGGVEIVAKPAVAPASLAAACLGVAARGEELDERGAADWCLADLRRRGGVERVHEVVGGAVDLRL